MTLCRSSYVYKVVASSVVACARTSLPASLPGTGFVLARGYSTLKKGCPIRPLLTLILQAWWRNISYNLNRPSNISIHFRSDNVTFSLRHASLSSLVHYLSVLQLLLSPSCSVLTYIFDRAFSSRPVPPNLIEDEMCRFFNRADSLVFYGVLPKPCHLLEKRTRLCTQSATPSRRYHLGRSQFRPVLVLQLSIQTFSGLCGQF